MTFRAAMRQAAVDLLTDYAATASVKLQVYPGRPRTIVPPSAYVDRVVEAFQLIGPDLQQRRPAVIVAFLHGYFDSQDAVDQGDEFVDGFVDYVKDRVHEAGANTTIFVSATEDDPSYTADWIVAANPNDRQRVYYATFITLEGFATD